MDTIFSNLSHILAHIFHYYYYTFNQHPKEIGQVEVVKEDYEKYTARNIRFASYLNT